eukprot:scaffold278493_cov18-Prasinocladus_malaysianus.AAC.3
MILLFACLILPEDDAAFSFSDLMCMVDGNVPLFLVRDAKLRALKSGEGLAEDEQDVIRLEAEWAAFDRAKERLTLKHKNT